MQLAMIGLGRMGGNMAKRIAAAGHEVVGYDRSPESDRTVASLEEMVAALTAPRIVWVMVPAGEATDSTINELAELLEPGDMIIDGGNSRYTDDARHAAELEPRGIHFMDCGVSGGVWGIDRGYALMVGGSEEDFERARPIFEALKPEGDSGLVLAGPVGGGHFAKMVHNGIEYGMMQAFGEGFATMVKSDLIKDPAAVMTSWRDGSVVQSWLLDLLAIAFKSDPTLESMPPVANESGEAKEVERKVFPGYVLIKMVMTDDTWHLVRNVRGVTGFVGTANKPIPLTEDEVLAMGMEKHEIVVGYNVGDHVRIVDGPLASFTGVVEEIEPEKNQVSVMVSMFGRETPVELELDQVEVLN